MQQALHSASYKHLLVYGMRSNWIISLRRTQLSLFVHLHPESIPRAYYRDANPNPDIELSRRRQSPVPEPVGSSV